MIGTIILILLILFLIGSLPTWGYSSGWGYYPSGGFGLVAIVLIILLLMGRIWGLEEHRSSLPEATDGPRGVLKRATGSGLPLRLSALAVMVAQVGRLTARLHFGRVSLELGLSVAPPSGVLDLEPAVQFQPFEFDDARLALPRLPLEAASKVR